VTACLEASPKAPPAASGAALAMALRAAAPAAEGAVILKTPTCPPLAPPPPKVLVTADTRKQPSQWQKYEAYITVG
jgi:hypothetical protein